LTAYCAGSDCGRRKGARHALGLLTLWFVGNAGWLGGGVTSLHVPE
jgi:hypothetical protein